MFPDAVQQVLDVEGLRVERVGVGVALPGRDTSRDVLLALVEQVRLDPRGSRAVHRAQARRERAHPRVGLSPEPNLHVLVLPHRAHLLVVLDVLLDLDAVHDAERGDGNHVLHLVAELVRQPLLQRRQVARVQRDFATRRVARATRDEHERVSGFELARASTSFRRRVALVVPENPLDAVRTRLGFPVSESTGSDEVLLDEHVVVAQVAHQPFAELARKHARGFQLGLGRRHLGFSQHAVARVEGERNLRPVPVPQV